MQVREGDIGDGDLGVLAPPHGFSALAHDFKTHNLQRERQQVFRALEVCVFFMQKHEHLLCQIFGDIPR